jgi:hypothetical protein
MNKEKSVKNGQFIKIDERYETLRNEIQFTVCGNTRGE